MPSFSSTSGEERASAMNADEMTIEQHLTVLYLLDVAMGENISAVEVNGFSDLPEGAVLLRVRQTHSSGKHGTLVYEIARDGSHRRHSPQEASISATMPERVWRGQDVEPFPGVWYPFRTATDLEWLEIRRQLGRDPLDPLSALEPVLDVVAPSHELETESGEPPLDEVDPEHK
jgi:hypothetical protein